MGEYKGLDNICWEKVQAEGSGTLQAYPLAERLFDVPLAADMALLGKKPGMPSCAAASWTLSTAEGEGGGGIKCVCVCVCVCGRKTGKTGGFAEFSHSTRKSL